MNSDYPLVVAQISALLSDEHDVVANAANISSVLYNNLDGINWAGFYFFRDTELVLGPFSGQPACTRIPVGKGVCGTAFEQKKTLIVDDVHSFSGHIACDAASQSELVVPFFTPKLSGVIDMDSPMVARFDDEEKALFESVRDAYVEALER